MSNHSGTVLLSFFICARDSGIRQIQRTGLDKIVSEIGYKTLSAAETAGVSVGIQKRVRQPYR